MEQANRYDPKKYSYAQDFIALRPKRLQQFEKTVLSRLPERAKKDDVLKEVEENKPLSLDEEKQPELKEQIEDPPQPEDYQPELPDISVSVIQKNALVDDSCSDIDFPENQEHMQLPIPIFLKVELMKQINRCHILEIGLTFVCCNKKRVLKRKRHEVNFHEDILTNGCEVCSEFEMQVTNIKVQIGAHYEIARTNLIGAHFKIATIKLVTKCGDEWKRTPDALVWRPTQKSCQKMCANCTCMEVVEMAVSIGEDFEPSKKTEDLQE